MIYSFEYFAIAGACLFFIAWSVSLQDAFRSHIRRWSWRSFIHAFTRGKRKEDLLIKVFGFLGATFLLLSVVMSAAAANAATYDDVPMKAGTMEDPYWCKNSPDGCTDYWKLQFVQSKNGGDQQEAINVLAKQAAEIAKGLKDGTIIALAIIALLAYCAKLAARCWCQYKGFRLRSDG